MKTINEYSYKGNKLYNVKKMKGFNYLGFDLVANWKDQKENNKEKLGNFYLKDLTINERNTNENRIR